MNEHALLYLILAIVFLFLIDACFYAFGAALQELNLNEMKEEAEKGDKRAKRILPYLKNPSRFIQSLHLAAGSFILLVGALLVMTIQAIHGPEALSIGDNLLLLLFLIVLLAVFQLFAVLLPKALGVKYPKPAAYHLSRVIWILSLPFLPMALLLQLLSVLIRKMSGIDVYGVSQRLTEEDIVSMVNEGHETGVLHPDEAIMIANIFEFGDTEAQDIMTHRTGMTMMEDTTTLQEAVHELLKSSYSRFPVFHETSDDIVGILHLKDAVRYYDQNADKADIPIGDLKDLIRKAHFVPETRKLNTLFREMQSGNLHMVIVLDEYGQTSGMVTMEDLLEEIVGNIQDEYDEEKSPIVPTKDGAFLIDGLTPIEEVEEALDYNLTDDEAEVETLNGFLIAELDCIPKTGEQPVIRVGEWVFQVLKVENKVIHLVRAEKIRDDSEEM